GAAAGHRIDAHRRGAPPAGRARRSRRTGADARVTARRAVRPGAQRARRPDRRRVRGAAPREAGRRLGAGALRRDRPWRRVSGGDRAVRTMAVHMALASMAVTATAVVVIVIGVLVFASASFQRLMVEHGITVDDARAMFDQSVLGFFVVAVIA